MQPRFGKTGRWILPLVAPLAFGVPVGQARAADYYVCDCQAGSVPECSAGDDSAPGTLTQPWRTYERARLAFGNMAAGDSLSFCEGGAWVIGAESGDRWVNRQCTPNVRCFIQAYPPPGVPGPAPPPVLTRVNADDGFDFSDGGLAESEGGYVVSGLKLVGSGSGFGVFLYNDVDHVTLRRLDISGFSIGVHLAGSQACNPADPRCDGQNQSIALRNSRVHGNVSQGWLGGGPFAIIENNVFERNGTRPNLDHNIYLSGDLDGVRVSGNTLSGAARDAQGVCQAASLVAHGQTLALTIDRNRVFEPPGAAGQGCWGIAVDPGYPGTAEGSVLLTIRGNEVRDVGNVGIGVSACQDCLIENNIIIQTQPIYTRAIAVPDLPAGAEDLDDARITIRNNSVLFGPSASGIGIDFRTATATERGRVVSNAIHYLGSDGGFNCLALAPPFGAYSRIDNNLCVAPAASGAEWVDGQGAGAAGLATWTSMTGHDTGSAWLAPGFFSLLPVDASDLRLRPDAAAIDAGHPTESSPIDFGGMPRPAPPDVGAWDFRDAFGAALFVDGFEAP